MARVDYLDDPNAPPANSLVPAASAIVTDKRGRILLHRRRDNDLWGLLGGTMEIGESIADTIVREVKEETGFDVQIKGIVGIYTNPRHVIAFSDGEVRQEFSICFSCRVVGGRRRVSDESTEVAFFKPSDIANLQMHDSIRKRINDHLTRRRKPSIN